MESEVQPDSPAPAPKRTGRKKGDGKGNRTERRWALVSAEGDLPLEEKCEPWEEDLAKWLAMQTRRVDNEELLQAATLLRGLEVKAKQLQRAKQKIGFKRAYALARSEMNDVWLAKAKNTAIRTAHLAATTSNKAVRAARRELEKAENDESVDVLPVLSRVPSLVAPYLAHVIPSKKESSHHATQINVTLTPDQAKGLEAPVMVVSAEEVKAQIPATT